MSVSIFKHHRYGLKGGDSYVVESPCGKSHFVAPITEPAPRIYTVSLPKRFLYVGTTVQPIRRRLYGARKAAGQNGYYGHPFQNVTDRMHLDLWTIKIDDDLNPREVLETIEAEVAYCCRSAGNWPELQYEIHFRCSNAQHRAIARKIYEQALNPTVPVEAVFPLDTATV